MGQMTRHIHELTYYLAIDGRVSPSIGVYVRDVGFATGLELELPRSSPPPQLYRQDPHGAGSDHLDQHLWRIPVTEPTPTDPTAATLDTPSSVEVATVLAQLGGVLLSTETIQTTVELVTRLAAETIPATAGAGVTLVDSRGQRTAAASNAFVTEVDALQYAFDSGPCLTASHDQAPVRVDDLSLESRWPRWTAAAAGLGVQSMLSVPLLSTGTSVGAIKVYSRLRDAYDARAEHVLGLFAEQAAALLAN